MKTEKLLSLVMEIGQKMLENGAEIYRVEESIVRICKSYGAKSVEVFAIPSSIIVTLDMGEEKTTMSKRIFPKETNLDIVDKLNNLSRYICSVKPDTVTIEKLLNDIVKSPVYSNFLIGLCYLFIPAAFALFFGGNARDAVVASLIGVIIKVLLDVLSKMKTNTVFTNILCSAVSSVLAILSVRASIGTHYDKIIIGTIMLLVPGLILTNSMRDFIMGDLMAGTLRLIEAVLVATGIAIGVALVLSFFNLEKSYGQEQIKIYYEVLYSFIGSLGFAFVFNIRGKKVIFAALGGALSQFSFSIFSMFMDSDITQYLFATIITAIYAELMARILKAPATIFLVPSIIPLVPGGMMYYSMELCILGKTQEFTNSLLNTIAVAGALAMGILIVSSLNKFLKVMNRMRFINKTRKAAK